MNQMGIIAVGAEPPPLELAVTKESRSPAQGKEEGRAGKRFQVFNTFIDSTMRAVSPLEALVWVTLWRDVKPNGQAQTSQADVARRIKRSTRTVRRALKALAKAGLLTLVRQGGLNRGVSVYRVHPTSKQAQSQAG
jgi:DNA-binding MarR family transcriptional regulator